MRNTVEEKCPNEAAEGETEDCCNVNMQSSHASSHSDDTADSTSSPTPSAPNQTVRAHRQLDDITPPQKQNRQIYLAACGIPPSSNSHHPRRCYSRVVFTASRGQSRVRLTILHSVFVGSCRSHLWPCLRFREQKQRVWPVWASSWSEQEGLN